MTERRPRVSLGLLETRGWVAAVEAADAMAKSAQVTVTRYDVTRDARITIVVRGPLADVEAAVEAGAAAARAVGEVLRAHVIPAPDPSLEFMLSKD
jgi:microcompartment protein CcmL/EutN